MAIIEISQGLKVIVDDDMLDIAKRMGVWRPRVGPWTTYAITNLPKVRTTIQMHRWLISAPPNLDVDHRDGNGLNNQRSNLRLATRSQNLANSTFVRGAVPFRGVDRISTGKYRARMRLFYEDIFLGLFDTAEEAALAYQTKRAEIRGEFAPDRAPIYSRKMKSNAPSEI